MLERRIGSSIGRTLAASIPLMRSASTLPPPLKAVAKLTSSMVLPMAARPASMAAMDSVSLLMPTSSGPLSDVTPLTGSPPMVVGNIATSSGSPTNEGSGPGVSLRFGCRQRDGVEPAEHGRGESSP